jgi:drug/metabolite transporter (DMT)-like permease
MAYLFLILTTLFWSGNFVLGRAMHLVVSPIVMAELRWLLALLLIFPFLLPKLKKNKVIILKHWPILTLLSVLSVACFNTFIYLGLTITTATNATILQSIIPIAILVLSALWLKESVSKRQWLGVFISLCGVLIQYQSGGYLRVNGGIFLGNLFNIITLPAGRNRWFHFFWRYRFIRLYRVTAFCTA